MLARSLAWRRRFSQLEDEKVASQATIAAHFRTHEGWGNGNKNFVEGSEVAPSVKPLWSFA